jgi:hypothetical protein
VRGMKGFQRPLDLNVESTSALSDPQLSPLSRLTKR